MRSSVLLSIESRWVSLLSVLQDSKSVFTHCIILSSEFSCSSPFSLWNLSLDSASTCGMVFPLTYIMSKSNAMILIAHLNILDDVTLGKSFVGLNKNSRGLWSNFKRNFWPNKKFCALSILQTIVHHHHHHHVVLVARISLTLSRHFSLSFIVSGRSSGQHPVSSHSCWMYVRAGRPAFAWPCVGGPQEYITYEFVPASQAVSCKTIVYAFFFSLLK